MNKSIPRLSIWAVAIASALFAGALAVRAEEPATQPAAKHGGAKVGSVRIAPYDKLTDLTDEQKTKIAEIHKKELADVAAIKDKEDADIKELLTDAQKAEVEKILAEKKAPAAHMGKKEKKGEGEAPTTAPAAAN